LQVREASSESDKKISDFSVEIGMNEKFYAVVKKYNDGARQSESLKGEDARLVAFSHSPFLLSSLILSLFRFVDKLLRDFKRNGLELPEKEKEALKAIKKKISGLCVDFSKNLNEDKSHIVVKKSELTGLEEDFVSSLSKPENPLSDDEVVVTTKYPHAFPVLRQCNVEATRKKFVLSPLPSSPLPPSLSPSLPLSLSPSLHLPLIH
jgi:Zn-dependent oligopeptidase